MSMAKPIRGTFSATGYRLPATGCRLQIADCRLPIAGIAGDQQAALFGQACYRPGPDWLEHPPGMPMPEA